DSGNLTMGSTSDYYDSMYVGFPIATVSTFDSGYLVVFNNTLSNSILPLDCDNAHDGHIICIVSVNYNNNVRIYLHPLGAVQSMDVIYSPNVSGLFQQSWRTKILP
ncbi:13273_t:CDS:2, partial [Racocetra persica]